MDAGWVEPKAKPTAAKPQARHAMGFASRYPSYGLGYARLPPLDCSHFVPPRPVTPQGELF